MYQDRKAERGEGMSCLGYFASVLRHPVKGS